MQHTSCTLPTTIFQMQFFLTIIAILAATPLTHLPNAMYLSLNNLPCYQTLNCYFFTLQYGSNFCSVLAKIGVKK